MIELNNKPLQGELTVTSEYGIRKLGGLEFHPGIDYRAAIGDNIYAVDDGKVVAAENDADGYGLYIVIEHSNYCTLYAHLKSLTLRVGQIVKAGDVVGHVGMTGMTTGPHLHFEIRDCLYDAYFWLKSILKGRHVMCIDPEELVKEAKQVPNVRYKKYSDRIHELRGDVKDLRLEIVDKKIDLITEVTNCTNGTFYWYNPDGTTYSTSILYQDGVTYQRMANHYYNFGCPQSVFIVYKDNTVALKTIYFLSELDLIQIRLVIGGIGVRNVFDSKFKYNPAGEGFKAGYNKQGKWEDQSGALRKTNHTVLGYNKNTDKAYLLVIKNATMAEVIKIISDNSTGEEFHIALRLDSGGSAFMDALWKYVVQGQGTRRIHNILRFN